MPYDRFVRFETAAVAWQDLVLLEAAPHWSPPYEPASPRLLLPQGGPLGCDIDGDRFVCDALSGIWLTPAQPYRLRQPLALQRCTVLVLEDGGGGPFTQDPTFEMSRRARLPLSLHVQLARWRSALRSGSQETLALEEGLLAVLRMALERATDERRHSHRAVERARECLAASPQADHTLAQIAAVACCSPFHLARQFRRATGMGLHGYRTRLRMASALQRIEQGQRDLSALAAELGYSSHSHFSAAFARHVGCAPGQLRTNLVALARR
jgi:AraC family transcriptional regulator